MDNPPYARCPFCGHDVFYEDEDGWHCSDCDRLMPATNGEVIAKAMRDVLISPSESDSNFEAANVVDGLFAIARGLDRVARAIEEKGT